MNDGVQRIWAFPSSWITSVTELSCSLLKSCFLSPVAKEEVALIMDNQLFQGKMSKTHHTRLQNTWKSIHYVPITLKNTFVSRLICMSGILEFSFTQCGTSRALSRFYKRMTGYTTCMTFLWFSNVFTHHSQWTRSRRVTVLKARPGCSKMARSYRLHCSLHS